MDAMATLARTGPSSLAAAGHRSSASPRPSASLSFAAAYSRNRGHVGLSTVGWSGRANRAARVTTNRIVASSEVEQSYIMIKPDGVQRGLVGEIISRFEKKGFLLNSVPQGVGSGQSSNVSGTIEHHAPAYFLASDEHYKDLSERPFFPKLIEYITSGPVVCMAWEGAGVVASARKLIGATNPLQAEPGTIRGDLAVQTGRNVVHGSDSADNGKREIALWFKEGELAQWESVHTPWLIE